MKKRIDVEELCLEVVVHTIGVSFHCPHSSTDCRHHNMCRSRLLFAPHVAIFALVTLVVGLVDGSKEMRCTSAAVGTIAELSCASDMFVSTIAFASFGDPKRIDEDMCSFEVGSCSSIHSLEVVETFCLGRNSCTIPVLMSMFGDDCGVDGVLSIAVLDFC